MADIDLPELEILLKLLNEQHVESFQGMGITVVFKDNEITQFETVKPKAQAEEDGHSTSNKRVDGFKSPALYPWQNGKVINFKGELV